MSDKKSPEHETESLVPEAEEIMASETPAAAAAETPSEASDADELRRENEELRQQMLRALAEAENVRRRATRDVSDARQYAVTSFARDMLNVSDNFKRALQSVENVDADSLAPEVKALLEGVEMTDRELSSVFERHGITSEDPTGQRFDPNKHQAMFEIENPEVASGTVLQVVQSGSMIGDRVLRPAMVGVSKGGPKPTAEKPAANDTDAAAGEAASSDGEAG